MGLRVVMVCMLVVVGAALAAVTGSAKKASASDALPADPVAVSGPGGAYAVAVPAFAGEMGVSGEALTFAVEDGIRDRLFSIAEAAPDGSQRTLYRPPAKRPGYAVALGASLTHVVALRGAREVRACVPDGECTPSRAEVVGGPSHGELVRLFGATEQLKPTASCRRRVAQVDDQGGSDGVSISGHRVAYARRVRCLSPARRSKPQIVVRDLRSGTVRVVRGAVGADVQLAGRFLASQPDTRRDQNSVEVRDLRSGEVVYRAKVQDWYSLGADGTLAVATFGPGYSLIGRLGWYSPRSPRLHRLPNRVSVFSASPLIYANGRIAYVRRQDERGAELAVTDLRGRARVHVRFEAPEELEGFDFDGGRLAFAHTPYRPRRGTGDDGLGYVCSRERVLVQRTATAIEVHPVARPGRFSRAELPSAPPYRSAGAERPDCTSRD